MRVHAIVVGQGLAGTWVAYQFLKQGKTVFVVDQPKPNSSSRVAAGIYNPLTGPRMVKTWMADEIFPFLETSYEELETFLQVSILHKKPIFRPFDSIAEQTEWFAKSAEPSYRSFVGAIGSQEKFTRYYVAPHGGLLAHLSGYVDTVSLLTAFSSYLRQQDVLSEEVFQYEHVEIGEKGVHYNGIEANCVVFCQGTGNFQNPFFSYLPLNGTKGQVLDVAIPGYTLDDIVNKGVFILPKEGFQMIGSNYEWTFDDDQPSLIGKEEIETKLSKLLHVPYEIKGQRAGVRPTVKDHRLLLGRHPVFPQLTIFNGLGTKGVSLAPYFSHHFVTCLLENRSFMPETDIQRFVYLYQPK